MSPDRVRRATDGLENGIPYETEGPGKSGLPGAASADARRIYRMSGLTWNRIPFIRTPRGAADPTDR